MFDAILTTADNRTIYLSYDREKYDIEYVYAKHAIILKRLSTNTVTTLEIFDDRIGFIIQVNTEGRENFVLSDYHMNTNGHENVNLKHYIYRTYNETLKLENEFECPSILLNQCRLAENAFIVNPNGYSGSIYNLKNKSKIYDRIYNDEKINEIIGENVILVSEEKHAFGNSDIRDRITYGINPETFEIITPIWSEMQQRYINVYTEEQVSELKDKLLSEGIILNISSLSDITIMYEVENYLNILNKYFPRKDNIYIDLFDSNINESFVKKFVK